MSLSNKKIGILVENNYQELEFWYPYYRLIEAGANVIIIGTKQKETYKSQKGYPAQSEVSSDSVNANELDALIIPGGYAPDIMRTKKATVNLVSEMHKEGKLVAAICHAGWVLISAGIVSGKKMTGYHTIKDDIVNAGAIYLDESVVKDGNIITSRQPRDLPDFCKKIIETLEK